MQQLFALYDVIEVTLIIGLPIPLSHLFYIPIYLTFVSSHITI